MDGRPPHRLARVLLGSLAAITLCGQLLAAGRAPELPALGMSLQGARVMAIRPAGPAGDAGLEPDDQICSVGGTAVSPIRPALRLLQQSPLNRPVTLEVERAGQRLTLSFLPSEAGRLEILWRLALAAVAILTVLTGVLVFFKKPRQQTLLFAIICYGMSTLVQVPYVPDRELLLALRQTLGEALTLLIPPLFVHLFLLFPLRHALLERRRWLAPLLYLPSAALLVIALARRAGLPAIGRPLPAESPLLQTSATLLWVIGVAVAIALFVHAYRRAQTGISRRRVRVILWGTILGTLPVAALLLLHQIWPRLQIPGDRLAVLFMVLIPLSFGYAMVRHGVFDATLLVRRSLAWSVLGAILVLAYVVIQEGLRALLEARPGFSLLGISFLSMLVVGVLLLPVQRGLRALLGSLGGSGTGEPRELLYAYSRALRGQQAAEGLVRVIAEYAAEALDARQVAFFEQDPQGVLEATFLHGLPADRLRPYRLTGALSRRICGIERPIDRGDLETELPFGYLAPGDQEVLELLGAEVLVPLRIGGELRGILLAGQPRLAEPFPSTAVRLAEAVAAEGSLALENALLQQRVRRGRRLSDEVTVARDLQERLLPQNLPQVESLEISGHSIPCRGVGGDYYDCFRTPWGELVLAIGDVSGKGLPGAILMANLQGLVRVEASRQEDPWAIVERINRRFCAMEKPDRFVTFCLARIDPLTGTVAYCNAGHPSPLLAHADGTLEELSHGGLPLGIHTEAHYQGGRTVMRSGEALLLHTDGITERRHGEEEFGDERLQALLTNLRRLSARALLHAILRAVRKFSPAPLDDDTTLMVVKLL